MSERSYIKMTAGKAGKEARKRKRRVDRRKRVRKHRPGAKEGSGHQREYKRAKWEKGYE